MALTPDLVEKIKSSIDIVELVKEYVPLKQSGRNFKAVCPFHAEKTPSFMVSREKQIFHCFGCGVGGDSVTFLMKHENLTFVEAIKFLAERLGIDIPAEGRRVPDHTARLYEIMEMAARFYERYLFTPQDKIPEDKISKGNLALAYLIKRGLTMPEIKKFRLGLASFSWDSLYKFLGSQGISLQEMERAGLIIKKISGGYYDRFRERLIFPIMNEGGKVVALGGRILNQGEPKYLNSPETPIYHKGLVLYGLNLAKARIAKEKKVIVVEGYMDLISLFQFGFDFTVATLGTALTPMQLKILKKFSPEIILAYDADKGGEEAVSRGMEEALRMGFGVRVLDLPQDNDPEDYLRSQGREALARLLKEAPDFFTFRIKMLERDLNPREVRDRLKIIRVILLLLKCLPSELDRMVYLKRLAEKYSIPEETLRIEFSNLKESRDIFLLSPPKRPKGFSREREVVKIILGGGELSLKARKYLGPEDFEEEDLKRIMALYLKLSPGEELRGEALLNLVEEEALRNVITGLLLEETEGPGPESLLDEFILKIMKERREKKARGILEEIKREEEAGNLIRVRAKQREYEELILRRRPLSINPEQTPD